LAVPLPHVMQIVDGRNLKVRGVWSGIRTDNMTLNSYKTSLQSQLFEYFDKNPVSKMITSVRYISKWKLLRVEEVGERKDMSKNKFEY
jgi:hypothetical protein